MRTGLKCQSTCTHSHLPLLRAPVSRCPVSSKSQAAPGPPPLPALVHCTGAWLILRTSHKPFRLPLQVQMSLTSKRPKPSTTVHPVWTGPDSAKKRRPAATKPQAGLTNTTPHNTRIHRVRSLLANFRLFIFLAGASSRYLSSHSPPIHPEKTCRRVHNQHFHHRAHDHHSTLTLLRPVLSSHPRRPLPRRALSTSLTCAWP